MKIGPWQSAPWLAWPLTCLPQLGRSCTLGDLFLRSPVDSDGNARPIDVSPVPGQQRAYEAWMDYTMPGFDLEATASPAGECLAQALTPGTTTVDPGGYIVAEVEVKSAPGQGFYDEFYTVNVSRLSGSETTLRALELRGALLEPIWMPQARNYSARLDAEEDIVHFQFLRMDEGQVVTLVSELEEVAGASLQARRLQATATADSVWETPVGEVQHQPDVLLTTLDVGYKRRIFLEVQSADQSMKKRYRFDVTRPTCPVNRRFFDPGAKACTDVCSEGFFGNAATGRCTLCFTRHCSSCEATDGGTACSLCEEGFELQDGSCNSQGSGAGLARVAKSEAAAAMAYWAKHWVIIAIGAVSTCLICAVVCTAVICCSMRRRGPRLLNSDDDDDMDYYEESDRS